MPVSSNEHLTAGNLLRIDVAPLKMSSDPLQAVGYETCRDWVKGKRIHAVMFAGCPMHLQFTRPAGHLADSTRRLMLDRLRQRGGQTLGEICEQLPMARQSATQHLDVLEQANLIAIVRRGRERLHYLDAAPIHEI